MDKWLEVGYPQKKEVRLSGSEGNPLRKLHGSINKRERISHQNLLNIIEYIFCERLFGQVLLIEKSAVGKVRQKKCDRKSVAEKLWKKNHSKKSVTKKSQQKKYDRKSHQKNCGRKSATEKLLQKKCGRKITAEKMRQKNRDSDMVGVYL